MWTQVGFSRQLLYENIKNGRMMNKALEKICPNNALWFPKGTDQIVNRDHPYITSTKGLGGWVKKMASFADVQYILYLCWLGGWLGRVQKGQKYGLIPTFESYVIDVPKAKNSSIKKVFFKPIDQG